MASVGGKRPFDPNIILYIVSEINNFAYYNASGAVNAKTKSILAFTIIINSNASL